MILSILELETKGIIDLTEVDLLDRMQIRLQLTQTKLNNKKMISQQQLLVKVQYRLRIKQPPQPKELTQPLVEANVPLPRQLPMDKLRFNTRK